MKKEAEAQEKFAASLKSFKDDRDEGLARLAKKKQPTKVQFAALIKFKGIEPPLQTKLRCVFVQKWKEVEENPDWTQTVHFTAENDLELKKLCKSNGGCDSDLSSSDSDSN